MEETGHNTIKIKNMQLFFVTKWVQNLESTLKECYKYFKEDWITGSTNDQLLLVQRN